MKNFRWNTYFFLLMLIMIYLLRAGTFIVYEGEQVVVTQFGKVFSRAYMEPGVYIRAPLIHKTHYFDKRIFTLNIYEKDITTRDRVLISVNAAIHWKIRNPVLFMENLETFERAESLLESMATSAIRDIISQNNLPESVRSSNYLSNKYVNTGEEIDAEVTIDAEHNMIEENQMIVTPILFGRTYLIQKMIEQIYLSSDEYGIEIINLVITDINYNDRVKLGVYERMKLERKRVAELYRSLGQARIEEIDGYIDSRYQQIVSPAKSTAEKIKGKGDALAIQIYAKEYKKDLGFYKYWRTLQAYRTALPRMEKSIFSSQNEFLEMIKEKPAISNIKAVKE